MSENPYADRHVTVPHNDVDQMDLYDRAMASWLQEFRSNKLNAGEALPVVQATPDRAFATIRELLKHQSQAADVNQHRAVGNLQNIPLPFVSFSRTSTTFDPERYNAAPLRHLKLILDEQQLPGPDGVFDPKAGTDRFYAERPLPYKLAYQVEVWARNQLTMDLVRQWLMLTTGQHGTYFYRSVDFTPVHAVYGKKWARFHVDHFGDASDLEPGDNQQRTLRFTIDLTVDAWLWRPVQVRKTVKAAVLQVVLGAPDDENAPVIDEINIDLLDQFREN